MNGSSLEYSPHGNALVPERAVEMGRCLGAVNFAGMIQRRSVSRSDHRHDVPSKLGLCGVSRYSGEG